MRPDINLIATMLVIAVSIFAANWLNNRHIDRLMTQLDRRLDQLEKTITAQFATVEQRFAAVEQRLDRMERQLEAIFKPMLPPSR
ncbi:MAG: hypothetical protein M3R15_04575 [Acidobacteriota bacterium]|nr:hypothetical protein [Acidobacteriota bacterium]